MLDESWNSPTIFRPLSAHSTNLLCTLTTSNYKSPLFPSSILSPICSLNRLLHVTCWEQEPPPLGSEVARAIRQTASHKATGPDEVPAELFKAGEETVLDRMHRICVVIWETGKWPEEWTFSTLSKGSDKVVFFLCTCSTSYWRWWWGRPSVDVKADFTNWRANDHFYGKTDAGEF